MPGGSDPVKIEVAPKMIVILRHGEKPDDSDDPKLTPEGYKRSFALAKSIPAKFGKPDFLFPATKTHVSNRPVETIKPLSEATGLPIDSDFEDKDFKDLAHRLLSHPKYRAKFIVICWHHEHIPPLAAALGANDAPAQWPDKSFDRFWRLDYEPGGKVKFSDLPQA